MITQAPAQYPALLQGVQRLVSEHAKLADEPLLLAIYYKSPSEPNDVFLFEVIENFGSGAVDPDNEVFEVVYNSTTGFELEPGQRLHMLLTNPHELEQATKENWPTLAELRQAIGAGEYQVLHSSSSDQHLMEMLHA